MKTKILLALILTFATGISSKNKKVIYSEENYGLLNNGSLLSITFEKGKEHNHPLFAIWLADENGNFIQTLYVSESIGTGVFRRANRKTGKWLAGEIQRPATLPHWAHQRGIVNENGTYMPTPKQPEIDARTGATPNASFILNVKTEKPLSGKYKLLFEINQSWDWNEFWFNDKYPNDTEYKTSSQPALIYSADIDTNNPSKTFILEPIGHSHYDGKNGSVSFDLSTLTTALKIAKSIKVEIK